jgi:hypothetical protein
MKKPKLVVDNSEKTHERKNRFTGESIMLTRDEAKKHDAIFYYEYLATQEDMKLGWGGSKLWDKVRENLNWFRQNNIDAYYVLLD